MRIYINKDWDFYFDNEKKEKRTVSIPHTVVETPFNAFSENIYQTVCRYEKNVAIPKEAKGKRIILHVGAAAHRATIYVNQTELYTHKCGYTAFDVDITEAVAGKNKANISIVLDTRESLNQPPFGNVIDYMTYGGIYRDVWIEIKDMVYIKSTYHRYSGSGTLSSKVVLSGLVDIIRDAPMNTSMNTSVNTPMKSSGEGFAAPAEEVDAENKSTPLVNITQTVYDKSGNSFGSVSLECKLSDGPEGKEVSFATPLKGITLWDIDNPVLYDVETTVSYKAEGLGEYKDTCSSQTGFRTVEWKSDGFYLNGNKVKIRGINRHQSYAYVGYAMPGEVQAEDASILKHELGMNAVRTSHYPQSPEFIEACDREGLLVFTEIPGWQHIGDDEWKNQAIRNVRDMVVLYRNHPSIVLWGVRINESMDDDDLYRETGRVAKEFAPGIFTGGVRFLKKSSLLEDVYTYNDFVHNGTNKGTSDKSEITTDMEKGYLVSEYNGHMFPTKPGDDEIHRVEHALRHARVLNSVYAHDDTAGSFGWCMFDYNTHKDFGSGDRICYHGIMDMFRNPKLAAALYKSQSEEEPVLEVCSDMNIGEYPAGDLRQVVVFTNLDSVKLYKNGIFIKEFFPDREKFADLPHPPVIVDDFIGEMLTSQEGYPEPVAKVIKKVLLAIRENGNTLPITSYLSMGRLMLFNKMTIQRGYDLYSKYVGGWGDKVKIYEYVGFKAGVEVMRVRRSPSEEIHLEVKAAGSILKSAKEDFGRNAAKNGKAEAVAEIPVICLNPGDGYTASSVRFRVLNQNDAVEVYVSEEVSLEATGSIEVIGPKNAILRGGMGGTYVRTVGTGEGTLLIKFRDETVTVKYDVKGESIL